MKSRRIVCCDGIGISAGTYIVLHHVMLGYHSKLLHQDDLCCYPDVNFQMHTIKNMKLFVLFEKLVS